jgi:copper(I)-binding protein
VIEQPLEFINAWARPAINNNTAAYLVIKNNSNNDYVLIGVSAIETANNVEIHKSFVDPKGVSRMTPVDKLLIPAQSSVTIEPAGIHIMLLDLKYNLKVGAKFKLNFSFEGTDPKTIDVEVKDLNK